MKQYTQYITIKIERKLDQEEVNSLKEMTAVQIEEETQRMKKETIEFFTKEGEIPKDCIKVLDIALVGDSK